MSVFVALMPKHTFSDDGQPVVELRGMYNDDDTQISFDDWADATAFAAENVAGSVSGAISLYRLADADDTPGEKQLVATAHSAGRSVRWEPGPAGHTTKSGTAEPVQ